MKTPSIGRRLLLLAPLAANLIVGTLAGTEKSVCQQPLPLLQDSPQKSQLQLGLKVLSTIVLQ